MTERKIKINIGGGCEVFIGRGNLSRIGGLVAGAGCRRAVIISDSNVFPLYGAAAKAALDAAGVLTGEYILPAGEKYKTLSSLEAILEFLASCKAERGDAVIALGGGVVGDLAGLAASLYLRGVGFYSVPTTLLAAVDASIGGKTAVNLSHGKNLAGSFYPPRVTVCDCDLFATLHKDAIADGMAEIVKYGAVFDEKLFSLCERGGITDDIESVVATCVELKKAVVEKDEYDRGERRLLNFGHTIGHAAERATDYKISHGSAVAAGMCAVCRAADALGMSAEPTYPRMRALAEALSLPTSAGVSSDILLRFMLSDKKRDGDYINMIIPEKTGRCAVRAIPVDELPRFLTAALGE